MKKNIGIIFGGDSVEHEVSIITALQVIENMDQEKYNCIPVYITKNGSFYSNAKLNNIDEFKDLKKLETKYKEKMIYTENNKISLINKKKSFFKGKDQIEIDLFFPIVHGTNVEDGKLQGFLETMRIPYIGTTTTSGVVGQDKSIMKDILKAHSIKQTNYIILTEDNVKNKNQIIDRELQYPVIVKPASLGSSIGIFIAQNSSELNRKIKGSFKYDTTLVVEEALEVFQEMNISVRRKGGEILTSAIEEVNIKGDLLTYEDKYLTKAKTKNAASEGMSSLQRILPAVISGESKKKIEEIAKNTYQILRCEGIVRLDLLIVGDEVYVNEVNNIPGSLAHYLWEEQGTSYSLLLDETITEGIKRYYKQKNKVFNFETNILGMTGKKLVNK